MYCDSHAHLSMIEGAPTLIERAFSSGVDLIYNICTSPAEVERGLELSRQFPSVHNIGSTTPHDVEKVGEEHFPLFEKYAREGVFVAIGETGLDYYYNHSKPEIQQHFLRKYLELARSCSLPVVIHCRDAFADLFSILDEYPDVMGVLHCFTGSLEEAKQVFARGWYLSLSGIVTFKKSEVLREVARMAPMEQLLIETDSPFLAPVPVRGKSCEPAFVVHTAKCIADVRGMDVEELAKATRTNAMKFAVVKT